MPTARALQWLPVPRLDEAGSPILTYALPDSEVLTRAKITCPGSECTRGGPAPG